MSMASSFLRLIERKKYLRFTIFELQSIVTLEICEENDFFLTERNIQHGLNHVDLFYKSKQETGILIYIEVNTANIEGSCISVTSHVRCVLHGRSLNVNTITPKQTSVNNR